MSQQQTTIAFVTEKAPGGGYKLAQIISLQGADGLPQIRAEVVTYRTRLFEVQEIEQRMKEEIFGEAANAYAISPALPPRPPRAMNGETPMSEADLPEGMPAVVESYRENGGVIGEAYRRANGVARALMPALFIASLWAAVNLRPLLA